MDNIFKNLEEDRQHPETCITGTQELGKFPLNNGSNHKKLNEQILLIYRFSLKTYFSESFALKHTLCNFSDWLIVGFHLNLMNCLVFDSGTGFGPMIFIPSGFCDAPNSEILK